MTFYFMICGEACGVALRAALTKEIRIGRMLRSLKRITERLGQQEVGRRPRDPSPDRRTWQHLETHLTKMLVGGQSLPQLQLLHHDETRAVRKGVLLVAMPKEHPAGFFGAGHTDPFPA